MIFNKERNYIRYRKLKAFCNSLCFYLCRIFPVKKNLVSVCTFEGKGGFGCNPKYLVQKLYERNPEYEFVWFVNDMTKESQNISRKCRILYGVGLIGLAVQKSGLTIIESHMEHVSVEASIILM